MIHDIQIVVIVSLFIAALILMICKRDS